MPLYLDKIISALAYPLGSSLLLLVAAILLLLFSRQRAALICITLASGWLLLCSSPVFSDTLRLSLESRFTQKKAEQLPNADFIVLLGGGISAGPEGWAYPDLNSAADRIWFAARLYHAGKAPFIIASGGAMEWHGERGSEAEAMLFLLGELGVPESAVILEAESRSTRENAIFTAPLVGDSEVLLVSSALHMPRALASFKAAGIKSIAAPTDFEVKPEPLHPLRLLPNADSLAGSTRAIKEYLGIFVYKLRGWA